MIGVEFLLGLLCTAIVAFIFGYAFVRLIVIPLMYLLIIIWLMVRYPFHRRKK